MKMTDTIRVPLLPSVEMIDVAVSHALSVSIGSSYTWPDYMRDLYVLMITSAQNTADDDDAQAIIDQYKADAERYRWLRTQTWNTARICVVTTPKESVRLGYDCPSTDRLDAAIDAAMAGGGE